MAAAGRLAERGLRFPTDSGVRAAADPRIGERAQGRFQELMPIALVGFQMSPLGPFVPRVDEDQALLRIEVGFERAE